jgi:Ca2+-binding RTX toxin-like protein
MRPRVTDVDLADLDADGILDIISPAQLPAPGFARTSGRVRTASRADAQATTLRAAAAEAPGLTLLLGHRPACTIVGTDGHDTLVGTRSSDVICGRGGDDRLVGRGASDVLRGGAGTDRLRGGLGVDVLAADAGKDHLRGGLGDDFLRGGRGRDVLRGERGRDVVDLLDRVRANDRGTGGPGSDHCRADRRDRLSGCR